MSSSILFPTFSNSNSSNFKSKTKEELELISKTKTNPQQSQQQPQTQSSDLQVMVINGKKWKFDKTMNKYVEFKTSNFDLIKIEYNECMRNLMTQINYKLNLKLNKEIGINKIKILRHSYFESIEPFDELVVKSIDKNGFKYTDSIQRTSKKNIEFINADPFDSNSMNNLHNIGKLNIRSIIQSKKFWNNCYQDLKFESMSIGGSFYDIFPNITKLMEFFENFINFFLISMNNLKPNIKGLTKDDEINKLQRFNFLFFTDSDYDVLFRLKNHFNELFDDQSNSEKFQIYNFNFILLKLIDVIISNLKSFKLPIDIETTWKQFFEFIFKNLLNNNQNQIQPTNYQIQKQQQLTSPNTRRRSSSISTSSSSNYASFTIPPSPSSMSPSSTPKNISTTASINYDTTTRNHSINSINSEKTSNSKRNGSVFTNESFNSYSSNTSPTSMSITSFGCKPSYNLQNYDTNNVDLESTISNTSSKRSKNSFFKRFGKSKN
ncbi:hypothetical protein KGF54_000847 [Candida jiufengensis]|uniref:uncharacterized protein n=1 Tax=Candida jiufengensis TaxID=497108 RepID=UPI0022240042|nr:uncharacterized protein KGF54_000847 [Candida jiufengensis]KAI5956372.1 hypothetical protein KGF54_000847 [Candida jiufengensis]